MTCSRKLVNGLIFTLIYVNAVSCFYEDKQQEDYTVAHLNITFCTASKKNCHSQLGEGRFGIYSPKEHASGWLVLLHEDNKKGCKKFRRVVHPELKPWLALIARGECNFNDKIENAYKHNASAVIIYNDRGSDELMNMKNDLANHIVSISVTQILGESLHAKIQNATVFVQITKGERYRTKWRVNPTSVLFVSVSFIVLMVISLAWLVFYYVQRFRYVHARDKTEKRLTSAAKKAIAKLPVRTVSRRDEPDETESCAVCLDGYKGGEQLRILPCNHEFHKPCIDPWLIEHRTCPMCKLNILKELGLTSEQDSRRQDPEVGFVASSEDHHSAIDNPVADLGDIMPQGARRNSRDSSSDSSGSMVAGARLLHVSADLNWERDTSSISNLVDNSDVGT